MKLRRDKQHAFDPGITIRASQISQLTVGLDEALIADASEVNYLKLKTVIEDFLEAETGVPCELSWRHGDQFRIEPADIVADRREDVHLFREIYDRKPRLWKSIEAAALHFLAVARESQLRAPRSMRRRKATKGGAR